MTPPDLNLPDDVEALRAFALAMAEKAERTEALESALPQAKCYR
jgi:transposase